MSIEWQTAATIQVHKLIFDFDSYSGVLISRLPFWYCCHRVGNLNRESYFDFDLFDFTDSYSGILILWFPIFHIDWITNTNALSITVINIFLISQWVYYILIFVWNRTLIFLVGELRLTSFIRSSAFILKSEKLKVGCWKLWIGSWKLTCKIKSWKLNDVS